MATKAWISLTARDLEESRHASLVEAVRRQARGRGQPDPLPDLITRTIDEVRGAVGFSGAYELSSDETKMAPNLADLAIQKIARQMCGRIDRALSDAENDDEREYQARLKDLIAGKWPVDAPTTAASGSPTAQRTTGTEQPTLSTSRDVTKAKMAGL